MNIGFFNAGIGAEVVAAEYFQWNMKFIHTKDSTSERLLKLLYPGIFIAKKEIPNTRVEIFSGRTAGPSIITALRKPRLDRNYLDLALQFFELASQLSARWVVWETIPRFLSSNKGQDFQEVLLKMGELGYGYAYRVLDAKYFGVPQTRRSLFVVGYRGDWRPPAAVLFERISQREYLEEDRKKRTTVKSLEELASLDVTIFPFKQLKDYIYSVCPKLPLQKYNAIQSNTMMLINQRTNETRQLMPVEWERLQGFMDGYTENISGELQPLPDLRRYSIIGYSGCVPVYLWIYNRLQKVEYLINTGD